MIAPIDLRAGVTAMEEAEELLSDPSGNDGGGVFSLSACSHAAGDDVDLGGSGASMAHAKRTRDRK